MYCTRNVILRRVSATTVAVEKQWVLHNVSVCICSLRYPTSNAHAPYCHLPPAPPLQYFVTLSRKWNDFLKTVTEHKMCVLIFSTNFVRNISHSNKNWARFDKKFVSVFTWSALFYGQVLMMCNGLHVKCSLLWPGFNESSIFWTEYRLIHKNQISWKSVQWDPRF